MTNINHLTFPSALLLIGVGTFLNMAPAFAVDPIGVRLDPEGQAEFYDTGTGLEFIPRGMNFIRVNFSVAGDVHSTFNIARYDPEESKDALRLMKALGYNVVRVFFNIDQLGKGLSEPGVNQQYMDNVIDFLEKARRAGIYVVLTNGGFLPDNYYSIVNSIPEPTDVEAENGIYFHPGHVKAYQKLIKDILGAISASDPDLLNAVFSFDVANEAYFVWDRKPWILESGNFQYLGRIYDMSSATDRQRLADRAAIVWANRLVGAARSISPSTMVATGLFTPFAVGRPGHNGVVPNPVSAERRAPLRARALSRSNFDYVDVHVYPIGPSYVIDDDLGSAEVQGLPESKPLLLGEYGAFKFAYPTIESATQAMGLFLLETCRFGFDGWLFWTWDTRNQPSLWYARESGGSLNKVIAPKYWPQICPS